MKALDNGGMSETAEPDSPSQAQRWREGTIGAPALLALFVLLIVVALAGASLGGGGGLAIMLIALISMIGLMVLWSTPTSEPSLPEADGAKDKSGEDEPEQA